MLKVKGFGIKTVGQASQTQINVLIFSRISDALGDSIQGIALPLLAFGITGDLAQSALVMLVVVIPQILFGAIAGPTVDRFDRKFIAIWFNVAQGLLLLVSPFVFAGRGMPAFLIISFFAGVAKVFASPAKLAAIPALLGDGYQAFRAKTVSFMFLADTLGPSIAAGIGTIASPATAVGFAGALNLVAAGAIAAIPGFDSTRRERSDIATEKHSKLLREGLRYTRSNTVVRGMLIYWFIAIAAVPITTLPALQYISYDLGLPYFYFGLATSVYAAGCVISSFFSKRLGARISKSRWMIISGVGYGLVSLAMGFQPGYFVLLFLWLIWGLLYGPEEVLGGVLFADAMVEEMRGRVYAFMGIVFSVATAVGYVTMGLLIDRLGAAFTMMTGGFLFIIAAVATFAIGPTANAIRKFEQSRTTEI